MGSVEPRSLAQAESDELAATFVGRAAERERVAAMMRAAKTGTLGEEEPQLLYLHGPGGIGKTTLLTMLSDMAKAAGARVSRLNCRDVEPSLAAIDAIAGALEDEPTLVLVDTFELLRPVEDRVREELVSRLGPNTACIVATRTPPSIGWRTLATWGSRVRGQLLERLSLDDARQYLEQRRLPPRNLADVLRVAKGNPLALALAADADRSGGASVLPERSPEVVAALCERLLRDEADPAHQSTLEIAGLLRTVTEEAIAALNPECDSAREFKWLRGKTFMRATPAGLVPHDLAQEAIGEDLRWRNPDRFDALQRRALGWLVERAARPDATFNEMLLQVTHLVRRIPALTPMFDLPLESNLVLDLARPDERDAIRAMVAKHEGSTQAALVDYWFDRQPKGFQVVRDATGRIAAISTLLELTQTTAEDRARDVAVRTVWEHAAGCLKPDDRGAVVLCRFTMGCDDYQAPTEQMIWASFLAVQPIRWPHLDLAYAYIRADHAFWTEAWKVFGAKLVAWPTYRVDDQDYCVATFDRRGTTAGRWLGDIAQRALASMSIPSVERAPNGSNGPTVQTVPTEFAGAVRLVLRAFHDTKRLAQSTLIDLLVRRDVVDGDPVTLLRAKVQRAIESLGESQRQARLAQVLMVTYVKGAETQEQAADALGLSFGTYRRYLQQALDELAERLWRESGGYDPQPAHLPAEQTTPSE